MHRIVTSSLFSLLLAAVACSGSDDSNSSSPEDSQGGSLSGSSSSERDSSSDDCVDVVETTDAAAPELIALAPTDDTIWETLRADTEHVYFIQSTADAIGQGDDETDQLWRVAMNGDSDPELLGDFEETIDLAVDHQEVFLLSDGAVYAVDKETLERRTVTSNGAFLSELVVGAENLYAMSGDTIVKIAKDTGLVDEIFEGGQVADLTFDGETLYFVSMVSSIEDRNSIYAMTPDGETTLLHQAPADDSIFDLTASNGHLFFAQDDGYTYMPLYQLAPSGGDLARFTCETINSPGYVLNHPQGILVNGSLALGADGNGAVRFESEHNSISLALDATVTEQGYFYSSASYAARFSEPEQEAPGIYVHRF